MWKETLALRIFGLTKIPMILFCRPSVVEMTDERVVIKIPLRRRTKNHLGSMYIGVLTAGSDLAGGVIALDKAKKSGRKIAILFKEMKADFIKRVDGDAHFTCRDGKLIQEMVQKTIDTGERVNVPVNIIVTVPSKSDEPVAIYTLTLTMKDKTEKTN